MGLIMAVHQRADAALVRWSVPAASCALETGSASRAFVSAASGDIGFNTGETGTIRLICPVSGLFPTTGTGVNVLALEFYDTDGTADTCVVQALVNRTNATGTEGGGTVASYSSADNGVVAPTNTSPFRNHRAVAIPHTFNFDTSFYWIEVILTRNSTACTVAIEGVQISGSFLED